MRLNELLQSGFASHWLDASLVAHWIAGCVWAGAACWFPMTESPVRSRVVPGTPTATLTAPSHRWHAGRAWSDAPLLWREAVHEFGVRGLLWRAVRYAMLEICFRSYFTNWRTGAIDWDTNVDANVAMMWVTWLAAAIDLSWTASRLFGPELHGRTWSQLVVTPRSLCRIVLEKLIAGAVYATPASLYLYGAFMTSSRWWHSPNWRQRGLMETLAPAAMIWLLYRSITLSAWLSTKIRHGASLLAVAGSLALMILTVWGVQAVAPASGAGPHACGFAVVAATVWTTSMWLTWRSLQRAAET